MPPLALILFITTATTTIYAQTTSTSEDWPSSMKLADLLHTETVIIENLRNYVNALGNKISTIKRKTQQIRGIYDAARNDTRKYFENPINTFNLIKRMTYEWVAIRNFAWQDVTEHIVANITELSDILTFPTEEDLDEAVTRLLTAKDVDQMEASQVPIENINQIKLGSKINWGDDTTIGRNLARQSEQQVPKLLSQIASEKYNGKRKIDVLRTMADFEYQSGNINEAIRLTEEILQLDPKNKEAIATEAALKTELKTNR